MTLARAREIARVLQEGFDKYGKYAVVPFRPYEVLQTVITLANNGNFDAPSKEDLTKVNRQLAALNARYEKLKQKCEEESA